MNKNMILTIFILILCSLLFAPILVHAQEGPYTIILSNITYNYIKTEQAGTQIFEFFNINITLRNLDYNKSDDITIELIDQDNAPVKTNHTFGSLEKKSFLFANHPISGPGDHNITIKFYPTNETRKASYNSGSQAFVVNKDNSQGGSTPGFEITLITIAFALFILLKKKSAF